MKISEVFYSVQGEIDIGMPAVFVRFSGCNLIDQGNACKFCDSLYAQTNGKEMTEDEVVREISKYDCTNVIFTGGEPLYHDDDLTGLVDRLSRENTYTIFVETNGTLYTDTVDRDYIDFINCSPKKQGLDIEVLKRLNKKHARFKFVYESKSDKWWESVIKKVGIRSPQVYIMPEGKTREEQLDKMPEVIDYCKRRGYNFTPRLHVLAWNTKKGV